MGLTREQAEALVAEAERAFGAGDVEAILAGYTDDVIVRYADFPELKGLEEAERFLRARFARQRDYRLRKVLRALDGDVLGNSWEGTWTDAKTGRQMQGRGAEFWTMRDGKIAVWDAAFNVGEVGAPPATPIT